MLKVLSIFVGFFCLFINSTKATYAINDPLAVPNNLFGIHISDENDLESAAHLVNSNGGEWGYVTVVIRDDDRDVVKWQRIFDTMRRLELIPLVRLATHQQAGGWAKPNPQDAQSWISFLSSLNWVIENRYVILFNEPNHAKEWGGIISPSEYAEVVKVFTQALKDSSPDYFILSAGFDMAAPNSSQTMDAFVYFRQMFRANDKVFTYFDGWSSHSYPNPGFTASPLAEGKTSIRSFQTETSFLEGFGLKKNIPIFITETGWIHKEGKNVNDEAPDADTVAGYIKSAYENAWKHPRVTAVTPFILNYPNPPFDHFSWQKDNGEFYPQYETTRQLPKLTGKPRQKNNMIYLNEAIPTILITESNYIFDVRIKNTGQVIWYEGDLSAKITSTFSQGNIAWEPIGYTEPGHEATLRIYIHTDALKIKEKLTLQMQFKNKDFGEQITREIAIVPPTSLTIEAPLALKSVLHTGSADLLIYEDLRLIKKIENIYFDRGIAKVRDLHDVVPGRTYRLVLTKPYYLPSQVYVYMSEELTPVTFEKLLPLDHNLDGTFSYRDALSAIIHPVNTVRLLYPFR